MITEEYLKDNFLTAYFVDNERQNIEIQTTTEDKKSVFTTIIPFKEENPQYQALNKFMTLDQLHESTYDKKKTEREIFESSALEIAKRNGLLADNSKVDSVFFPTLVKAMFEDKENEDQLFALKLAIFETDKVMNSENIEEKSKLRKSKNKIDVLQSALELFK